MPSGRRCAGRSEVAAEETRAQLPRCAARREQLIGTARFAGQEGRGGGEEKRDLQEFTSGTSARS